MRTEIIESFRENFELIREQIHKLQNEIKEEASKEIGELIANNRFDDSQKAVEMLKGILRDIDIDMKFDSIYHSLDKYMNDIANLKSGDPGSASKGNEEIETKEVSSKQAFELQREKQVYEEQSSLTADFMQRIQEKLKKKKYAVANVNGNDIDFRNQKNKYFYLTATSGDMTEKDYIETLERRFEKKNIGFICNNESEIEMIKPIAQKWANKKEKSSRKFLTINFTTTERLEGQHQNPFETLAYN